MVLVLVLVLVRLWVCRWWRCKIVVCGGDARGGGLGGEVVGWGGGFVGCRWERRGVSVGDFFFPFLGLKLEKKSGGVMTNKVCSSINLYIPSESSLKEDDGDVESRNKIVGVGSAVSVEKRRIRSSAVLVEWRVEAVRMRNACVVGLCCCWGP